MNNKGLLARIIGAFIPILIAVMLYPMIKEQIQDATTNLDLTTEPGIWASTVLSLMPGLFAVGILFIAITIVIGIWREYSGEDEEGLSPEEVDEIETKPKKKETEPRNYKEYVKERIEVEQMMGAR